MLLLIATLAWALWFGGLMALFIFVLTLFHNNREIAVQAAPQLFLAFQRYHLILAAVALAATVLWRIVAPSKFVLVNFILLGLAACAGVAVAVWIIGPMEALREQGLGGSDEFKKLHGISMMLFCAQAILLLIYGVILPFAISAGAKKSVDTAAATGSRA
jgi:hypothetical protein